MAAAALRSELAAHLKPVRGQLLGLTRDPNLADDLAQEALLRAVRALPRLRGESSTRTWITAIALNLARDHFRAAKRTPETMELTDELGLTGDPTQEVEVLQAEMSACILGHVARLPARERQAVLLRHFGGFSHAEIARQLGVSEGNARVILHRGLEALRRSLTAGCVLDFHDAIPCEPQPASFEPLRGP